MLKQIWRIPNESFPRRVCAVTVFEEFLKNNTYLFLRTYGVEGSFEKGPGRQPFEKIADATVQFISDVYTSEERTNFILNGFKELSNDDVWLVPIHSYVLIEENPEQYVFKVGSAGLNLMTLIASILLKEKVGINVDFTLVQTDSNSRNGSTDRHRFMCPTSFSGDVVAGRKYIVFDDHIKTGNTVANLAGYIHERKGEVLGFYTLSCNEIALGGLRLPDAELASLREKMFEGAEELFCKEFGYGFNGLTWAEANILPNIAKTHADWEYLINYPAHPEPGMFEKSADFLKKPNRQAIISLKPLGISKNLVILPSS